MKLPVENSTICMIVEYICFQYLFIYSIVYLFIYLLTYLFICLVIYSIDVEIHVVALAQIMLVDFCYNVIAIND